MKKIILSILTSFLVLGINAQVTVDNTSQSVEQWVQNVLAGPGVVITNVEFNGSAADAAIPNEQVGSFNDVNSDIGLASGIILGSGDVSMAEQLNTGGGSTLGGTGNAGTDTDLGGITTGQVNDECIVEFDFVPAGDTISFKYVFASEEYEEYVCGNVNDAFGFFLTGTNPLGGTYTAQNIALIPDPLNPGSYTTTAVSINTVNPGVAGANGTLSNCTDIDPDFATYNIYYTSNTTNTYEYDGNTVVLEARAYVNCGEIYHIKLGIGDVFDSSFDSGVFLEAGSFSSESVQVSVVTATGDSTVIEGCADATINFTRPDTAGDYTVHFEIGGNADNGVDYVQIADSIMFLAGEDSAALNINPIADFDFTEGEDTISITAITINACGDTIRSTGYIYILDLPNMTIAANDLIVPCPTATTAISVLADQALQPFTYEWFLDSINGPMVPGSTNSPSINVSGMVTDTFYVSVTDSCNLVTLSDTIIVTVNISVPEIDSTTVDSLIHCGESISMEAFMVPGTGTAPFSFSWNGQNGNPSPIFSPIADSVIYVTVTDFCGLTDIDSVLLTLDTIPITIDTVSMNDTINCGESISLGALATNGTFTPQYFWTPVGGAQVAGNPVVVTPAVETTYVLEAAGNCISAFDTVTISIDTIPVTIDVTNNTTTYCLNDPVSLLASPSDGSTIYTYTWDNVNPPVNATNANPFVVTPATTTTYYVMAEGGCNTSFIDSVVVTVDYTPMTLALSPDVELLCENKVYDDIEVIATVANGNYPYNYNWGAILDTDSILDIDNVSNPGQVVTLTVTDGCNNTVTESMNITFRPYVPMIISALPVDSICLGEFTSLPATAAEGIGPYTYSWTDGVNSFTGNPVAYSSLIAGINTVTLSVADQCTSASTSVDVLVIPCAVNIPNVITPNGDNSNDLLVFENLEYFPTNNLQIFNRWGKKIHEEDGYKNDWNGSDFSEGTYFFILTLNNFENTVHKGTFTLLK